MFTLGISLVAEKNMKKKLPEISMLGSTSVGNLVS
jgi:hypothetical protein